MHLSGCGKKRPGTKQACNDELMNELEGKSLEIGIL